MQFVVISDTHGLHRQLKLPKGDIIIHVGDFCGKNSEQDTKDFLSWFSGLTHTYKVFICGNHDFYAARRPDEFRSLIPQNVVYLNDSGVRIGNLKFWGSPVQPDMSGWAFGKDSGAEIRKHWNLIPDDIDVLITHTPPLGILDKSRSGTSLGCDELTKKLKSMNLQAHLFGHVHASYGRVNIHGTININASNYDSNLGLVNKPFTFKLDIGK